MHRANRKFFSGQLCKFHASAALYILCTLCKWAKIWKLGRCTVRCFFSVSLLLSSKGGRQAADIAENPRHRATTLLLDKPIDNPATSPNILLQQRYIWLSFFLDQASLPTEFSPANSFTLRPKNIVIFLFAPAHSLQSCLSLRCFLLFISSFQYPSFLRSFLPSFASLLFPPSISCSP